MAEVGQSGQYVKEPGTLPVAALVTGINSDSTLCLVLFKPGEGPDIDSANSVPDGNFAPK